uniref:Uncharacterized protein n=1 Tax=Oryzias latipes TaxID=8090 RepID=A0A3P9HS73_ORYLA
MLDRNSNSSKVCVVDHQGCLILELEPANLLPCNETSGSHRWKTGEWSSCSATCGVGLMTRAVACTHRPFADSNRTVILGEGDCHPPKPSPVQACNRFDCPPLWDLHPWGQCSQSCAGGVQRRRVLCKQRLADGSVMELPDSFCPSRRPPSQQQCGKQDCPAQWITTDWSQVVLLRSASYTMCCTA